MVAPITLVGLTALSDEIKITFFTCDLSAALHMESVENILFDNPAAAAKHLNKVWDNVNIWWESKEVQSVRNQFFSEACDSREKYLDIGESDRMTLLFRKPVSSKS